MKAAVLNEGANRLQIEDVPDPVVGPGDVRVRVRACGVCGSDVHATIHPVIAIKTRPRIMGHESAGVIESIGSDVTRLKVGQRVVIGAGTSCGQCAQCLAGRDNACEAVGVLGFDRDGAFAELISIPERYVHPLPDQIPFDQGAILADAVSTPYHALRYTGRLEAGETLAVVGCGGLGVHAILLGRALGAGRVVAVDVEDGALRHASEFGADDVIDARRTRNIGKTLREVTGGVDVIADFSGFYPGLSASLRALNPRGRAVMVGIGRSKLEVGMAPMMIYRQLCICGSYGCERNAVPELIELVLSGKLDLSRSVTSHHPLHEVNQCLEDLHHRKGNPVRFVIQP